MHMPASRDGVRDGRQAPERSAVAADFHSGGVSCVGTHG